jgi:hypothetical protein
MDLPLDDASDTQIGGRACDHRPVAWTSSLARRLATVGALSAFGVAVLAALGAPAGAHGAEGTMGIEVTPGTGSLTARVRVLLEYANDRDLAPGATVVAAARGPGGQTVGPVPLADRGRGLYEGTLTMPVAGTWNVTVSAANPTATAQADVVIAATPTTSTTAGPPSGDVRTSSDREARGIRAARDDEGGSGTAAIALAIVALAAGVGIGWVVVMRWRRA